jgi:hypothetical protein
MINPLIPVDFLPDPRLPDSRTAFELPGTWRHPDHFPTVSRPLRKRSEFDTFLALDDLLTWGEFRWLDMATLARNAGFSRRTCAAALKLLLSLDLIERQGEGPDATWRLSPSWGFKGTGADWYAACLERQRRHAGAEKAAHLHPLDS